jgi:hypothetical protein
VPTPAPASTAPAAHLLRHIAAAGAFATMAVVWSFPLVRHLPTHLPGAGPGDNIDFLWNFWWMRTALASGLNFFRTTYLFVPAGADLTLHTHTALPALLGATVLGGLPVVAAQNLTILMALFLNGFCAYLLAWRITRDHGAAMIGGIVFGGSPYIAAHLNGHFNLITAWTIPLFAIAASEAVRGSTARWAVLSGLLLGATAYVDYYYVVYEFALALCLVALAAHEWSIASSGPSPRSRRLTKVVGVLILVDVAVIAAIAVTGGFDARIGPMRISAHGIFNELQAFWILVALSLWLWLRPRVDARRTRTSTPLRPARAVSIMTGVFLVVAAPLVWNGVGLFLRGQYVTPRYFWRSAPTGIDLATLVLGNPFHAIWGDLVQRLYRTLGIDVIESTGWPGIAPIVLAAWALRRRAGRTSSHGPWARPVTSSTVTGSSVSAGDDPSSPMVRQWAVIGLVFFVWALGPHLMVFGINTGMILPQALLHYVPIISNARIPGRAIVVAYLALAVVGAVAAAEWRQGSRHGLLVLAGASLVLAADYLPAPFPLTTLDHPGIYETLRDRRERGSVCELPLGIRDGFGEHGSFDDRVLFYQTIHGRRLVGGFVARLPQAVTTAYEDDPLLSGLLRLSEREGAVGAARQPPDRQLAAERLREIGIAFVVLNRRTASPSLAGYVERVLPLTRIAEDGERSLYLVSQ